MVTKKAIQLLKNDSLQNLCRGYLFKLRQLAKKYNLSSFLDDMIKSNLHGDCKATKEEVDMLSRMVNEERIGRHEIPDVLGVSYRFCNDNDLYKDIRKFQRDGVYSMNDTLIMKDVMEFEKMKYLYDKSFEEENKKKNNN